jgi:SAM-dependent methyltransferase
VSSTMKFVTDLSKGILGVSDSLDMWTNIINDIPDTVFLKEDLRILNICCGHGTEADLIVKRMKALGIPVDKIQNSLFLLDKYHVFTNRAKRRGYTNVITSDFLDWNPNMKFDVVVGNPPFQSTEDGSKRKKMWVQFADKAIDMAEHVAFVTPAAWQKDNAKYFKDIAAKIKPKLIAYNDANSHFNVGEDIGYWVVDNSTTTPIQIVDNNPCSPIYKKMLRKGDRWHYRDFQQPHSDIDKVLFPSVADSSFNVPIYWTAKQTRYCRPKDVKYTGWKVIVNNSGHYYSATDIDKYSKVDNSMTVGLGAWGIKVKDQVEGNNVLSWVRSKLYRVVVTQMKTGGFNNPFIELESLGATKAWTDDAIYQHFKLTQEEIEYIESNINTDN